MTGDPDAISRLREKLVEMRADALDRMIRRGSVEPGHLPLIAGIKAVIDTLDSMPVAAEPATRAVVSDDSEPIRLTLYSEAGALAAAELTPAYAIALAGRLLDAAGMRLCCR
jgi:hypothetical protein